VSLVDAASREPPSSAATAKRTFDVAVSGCLLVLLGPALVAVGALVTLDALLCRRDRGPVLYRERRISAGREFDLLKFRTLRRDVLAQAHGHVRLYEGDLANLTWAGRRVLKPWYLDELPQLVNVLRGDRSLVGPRPWPRELVERQLAAGRDYRMLALGGWTGPAQVSKGGDPVRYADLDLEYVDLMARSSAADIVRYDLRILRETFRTIARGQGLAN
jgi:lipopolysaccharide/colanic/teichoic acid biosynthesis glycosyltransferase